MQGTGVPERAGAEESGEEMVRLLQREVEARAREAGRLVRLSLSL